MSKELVDEVVLEAAAVRFDRWLSEIALEASKAECQRVDKLRRSIQSAERLDNPSEVRIKTLQRSLELALADVQDRFRRETLRVPTVSVSCPDGEAHCHRVVQVGVG
jgi:hypothetical protein